MGNFDECYIGSMKTESNGTVSWRQLVAVFGALSLIAGLHAVVVMPMILNSVSPKIDEAVQAYHSWHIQHVHPGAVTEKNLEKTLEPMKMRLDSIDRNLEKIEKRISH